jgi:membrane-bound lytic murein transglycosylase A
VRHVLTLLLAGLLGACTTTPPSAPAASARYLPATWTELPAWPGEQLLATWPAWLQSCTRLQARPAWQETCAAASALAPENDATVQAFYERHFQPWRIEAGDDRDTGLVTGYYEALLTGSLSPGAGRVPLYGVPDDMLTLDIDELYPDLKGMRLRGRLEGRTVLPYWSRAEIDSGKGVTPDKILAWADDPLDAFFLQIQGSGRVQLEDGRLLRLGYADQNGHPYRAIGKWLVEQGQLPIEQVSMQSIRAWAQAHPERVPELLEANPSYVFFRLLPDEGGGPIGALNVPLTAAASIAVDPKFVPLGSPVYLATTRPDTGQPLQRLVQAQDTGGAIRGAVRADFFWGYGPGAAALAGQMKQPGRMWLLWPKALPLPALPAAPPAPAGNNKPAKPRSFR